MSAGWTAALGAFAALLVIAQQSPRAAADTVDELRECVAANAPRVTARHALALRTEDDGGLVEERRLAVEWRRDAEGEARTLVRLEAPADLAGTAVLIIEPRSGPREVHLHLPEIGKTRRVRSARQLEGLLGAGAIGLEEVDGLAALVERPGLLLVSESEQLAGRPAWVVEARSADQPPHAERTIAYIDRALCVALRVDLYRNSDRPTARILADAADLLEAAHVRVPRVFVAEDLTDGSRTTFTIERLEVDVPLDEDRFRLDALGRR